MEITFKVHRRLVLKDPCALYVEFIVTIYRVPLRKFSSHIPPSQQLVLPGGAPPSYFLEICDYKMGGQSVVQYARACGLSINHLESDSEADLAAIRSSSQHNESCSTSVDVAAAETPSVTEKLEIASEVLSILADCMSRPALLDTADPKVEYRKVKRLRLETPDVREWKALPPWCMDDDILRGLSMSKIATTTTNDGEDGDTQWPSFVQQFKGASQEKLEMTAQVLLTLQRLLQDDYGLEQEMATFNEASCPRPKVLLRVY